MEIRTLGTLVVRDSSHIAAARRLATGIARSLGFDEPEIAKIAIVVTEAVTNVVRYAKEGEIVVNSLPGETAPAMAFIVLDKGPGIANISEALRDGHSTSGGAGTGLGAITRIASKFEIYSMPGEGTALLLVAGKPAGPRPGAPSAGGISVPYPGEEVCGDAWTLRRAGTRLQLLVVDGLGHGLDAAEAARAAVAAFNSAPFEAAGGVAGLLDTIHAALRGTRGAVAAVADIDPDSGRLAYAGIGNISAVIATPEREHDLISHPGTLGAGIVSVRPLMYEWPPGAVLVMHSDGLSRRWRLDERPALLGRDANLIAGVLYRDHRRERDDATIAVVKDGRPLR